MDSGMIKVCKYRTSAPSFRNGRRPSYRYFDSDECAVCGSGHPGSWRILGAAISSSPKIKFVAVVKGNCWLSIKHEVAPLQVKTGDVFVLPAERAYVLAGDLSALRSTDSK